MLNLNELFIKEKINDILEDFQRIDFSTFAKLIFDGDKDALEITKQIRYFEDYCAKHLLGRVSKLHNKDYEKEISFTRQVPFLNYEFVDKGKKEVELHFSVWESFFDEDTKELHKKVTHNFSVDKKLLTMSEREFNEYLNKRKIEESISEDKEKAKRYEEYLKLKNEFELPSEEN